MDSTKHILSFIAQECSIFFGFSWRDWSTTLIPGTIIFVAAMYSTILSLPLIVLRYACLVVWLTHFVYLVTLSNQITGVAEDRINKPDRPIPSGRVSLDGAKARLAVTAWAFFMVGVFHPAILAETICWISMVVFLNWTATGNHWFGKNCVAMTLGTWALLSGSWKIIAPLSQTNRAYLWTIAIWVGILMQIQDLRDMEGDAKVGRRTMQLVFGDKAARIAVAFGFIPSGFWILYKGELASVVLFPLSSVHVYLGYRALRLKGARYDHKTYMIFTYLFCAVVASTIFKQPRLGLPQSAEQPWVATVVNLTTIEA